MKVLLVLAVGLALGYSWGWRDAQLHDEDVVTRLVHQAGGKTRASVRSDADHTMDSLERR